MGERAAPRLASVADDVIAVLPPFVAARAIVALGYVLASAVVARSVPGGTTVQLGQGLFAWDGAFYRDLAELGFGGVPIEAVRFFPLYPLAGDALGRLGLGGPLALVLAANVAALAALVLLRRLARFETEDDALAGRAVAFAALAPSAFVLVWAYAEAFYLVGAIGAFLAARRGRWGWAVPAAAVAVWSRPLGLVLVVPLAIEAVRQWRAEDGGARLLSVAACVTPVVALALHLVWIGLVAGDAFAPVEVQDPLRGGFVDPISRFGRALVDSVGAERFGDGLHTPFVLAAIALVVVSARRWPASYAAFAGAVVLVALSADNLNSFERYALNAFPLVLALASVTGAKRAEWLVLALSGGGLLALSALAWLGVFVP